MSSTPSMPSSPPYIVDGKTDAERYLEGCLDGSIVACKTIKQLAKMMLPRFHQEYHGYHFDVNKALRPCQFLERFTCIVEGSKRGQPFILEQFQRMMIELAYGFVDDDGIRQFNQSFLCMGRKNGKTALISGLGLYHLTSDGEQGAEVYCCATSEQQASKCYGSANDMVEMSPFLKKRIRRGKSQKMGKSALNYDANGSVLVTVAASPKRMDGKSASAIIYDELAAVEDNGFLLDQLEESTAARRQPMTWILSSENYIRDGIWDERMSYCKGILNGTINDDTVLPLIFTLDDRSEIYDEKCWTKANPGLYSIKDINYLRKRVNTAKKSARSLPSVLTKEFCLRSGAYSSFLDIEACINDTPIDFNVIGIPPYVCVGFDLASRNDLCAMIIRWRVPGDDRIYEIAKFWIASDMLNLQADVDQKDKVPYLLWSTQGQSMGDTIWHYVDVVEGDRVNQSVIIDTINDMCSIGMYPYCIAYDGWHVDDYTKQTIRRQVGDTRCFEVPQTARVLSPLMRTYELDLKAHKVICPNPCLHHSRQSLEAREDNGGNLFPRKRDLQPHQKIDGAMSEMFAIYAEQKVYEAYISAIGWEPPETNDGPQQPLDE